MSKELKEEYKQRVLERLSLVYSGFFYVNWRPKEFGFEGPFPPDFDRDEIIKFLEGIGWNHISFYHLNARYPKLVDPLHPSADLFWHPKYVTLWEANALAEVGIFKF